MKVGHDLRISPFLLLLLSSAVCAQSLAQDSARSDALPEAPSALVATLTPEIPGSPVSTGSSTSSPALPAISILLSAQQTSLPQKADQDSDRALGQKTVPLDASGKPIPLEMQQPTRILGFMPNFRSVSGGARPHPPGWKYNFQIATKQSFDYSSFIFLGLTSISAEGLDEHPKLGKGVPGLYAYGWRGFVDKTDQTYLSGWLLASLLHEDTRFYALGRGHSIPVRAAYVISRQAVARTYRGHETLNIAGLGGKVLTQVISREYYPTGTSDIATLAEKFGFAAMRDVMFSSIREFYPDVAAHYIRKHREKMARVAFNMSAPPGQTTPH